MSELLRQQQRAKEIKDRLYGKSRVVNVAANRNLKMSDIDMSDILESNINTINKAKAIVRRLSHMTPYSYEEITGKKINKKVRIIRNEIMREVKKHLPHITFEKLGEVFNRDYTSIQYALGKTPKGKFYSEKINRRMALQVELENFVHNELIKVGMDYERFTLKTRGQDAVNRKEIYVKAVKKFKDLQAEDFARVFHRHRCYISNFIMPAIRESINE